MSDDVLDAFDQFLLGHLPAEPENQESNDSYFRLLHIPEGLPETLWCISKTDDTYEVKIVQFCESAWRAFWKAHARQDAVPIVHRSEAHQSLKGPFPPLDTWMDNERFALCDHQNEMEWNCDQYRLYAQNHRCWRSIETINPKQSENIPWIEIIEILEELANILPLNFKEYSLDQKS